MEDFSARDGRYVADRQSEHSAYPFSQRQGRCSFRRAFSRWRPMGRKADRAGLFFEGIKQPLIPAPIGEAWDMAISGGRSTRKCLAPPLRSHQGMAVKPSPAPGGRAGRRFWAERQGCANQPFHQSVAAACRCCALTI